MLIIEKSNGYLIGAMSGQSLGRTTMTIHDIDVHAALTVGSKSNLLAVRTPYGNGVVGSIGG